MQYFMFDLNWTLIVSNFGNSRVGVRLVSGALKMLQFLKNHGKTVALVTSASKRKTYRILDYFNLGKFFEVVVTKEDVQCTKPCAEPYELALRKLKADQNKAVVFEDSWAGIKSAKSIGLFVVGVNVDTNAFRSIAVKPDVIIKDYNELFANQLLLNKLIQKEYMRSML